MIEIDKLSYSYGANKVLSEISTRLLPGRVYGLLGENGVGKTTLLTLLCGLKRPSEGSVLIDGKKPFDRLPSLLEQLFCLPEQVPAPGLAAERFALGEGRFRSGYDHGKFRSMMGEFDVRLDQRMDRMSAGQLKKTWISLALASGCRYLFLDEPTNGLDIPSKTTFRSALLKYSGEDCTTLISTHQVRDLENVLDTVIILEKRAVLLNAGMEEITAKLFFGYGGEPREDALYLEKSPAGLVQVYPNTEGADSKANLEALFNAARSHKDEIRKLFDKQQ